MDFTTFKFMRFATEEELQERKDATLGLLSKRDRKRSVMPFVSAELISYLKLIRNTPNLPATQRDRLHEIKLKKGVTLRASLFAAGLVQEFSVSTGTHGKNFKSFRLTEKGKYFLTRHENRAEN